MKYSVHKIFFLLVAMCHLADVEIAQGTPIQIGGTSGSFDSEVTTNAQLIPDSGRIDQQLEPPEAPKSDTEIKIPASEDFNVPEGLNETTFQLSRVNLEGGTVYSPSELEAFYQDFLGQEISLSQLYEIAQKITLKYRDDGYILSLVLVPEQTVDSGEVTLKIIEGFVETVQLQNVPDKQRTKVQNVLDKITESKPLNVRALERYLLLANDLAGLEVRAILQRGTELGTARLLARVTHDAFDPFFDISNRGSSEVGNVRLQLGSSFNSFLGLGESLTLRTATSPENFDELALGSADFRIPVGNDGLNLNIGASYTEINPGGAIRLNDINGRSFFTEIGLRYPLIRSRSGSLYVGTGFDYADTRNITDLQSPSVVLSQDRLAVLRLNLNGDTVDSSGGFLGGLTLSQGIAGTTPADATLPLSREQGSAVFTKVNLNVSRVQTLPASLVGLFQAKAQFTGDSLLVREQFGLGGSTFGSAFNPDEVLGDYGYGLRVELQRPFRYRGWGRSLSTQPYVFSDFGQVFRRQPSTFENSMDTLGSAGLGVRQTFGDQLRLALEMAFPLERSDEPVDYEPRFFFTLTGFF